MTSLAYPEIRASFPRRNRRQGRGRTIRYRLRATRALFLVWLVVRGMIQRGIAWALCLCRAIGDTHNRRHAHAGQGVW